jgi:poly(beta-D-mannuronate) lyase
LRIGARLVAFALLTGCAAVAGDTLHSPWQNTPAPPPSAGPYACPPEPSLPRVLVFDGYYTDSHYSIIDPAARKAYEAATFVPDGFGHDVVRAVDEYRLTGSEAAGRCAVALLYGAADQRAFTEARLSARKSRQGLYVQTWLCAGLALAYLKVEGTGLETPAQRKKVASWLADIAGEVRAFHNRLAWAGAGDSRNNHRYWAGLAVAAAGIVSDRRDLFDWGMRAGRDGLAQITEEGTLPREMDRASMALHYHLFAAAPLVILAELGEPNGIDLYSEKSGALQRLVMRAASGLVDPSFFEVRTGVPQQRQDPDNGATITWAAPFAQRFPNALLSGLLAKAPRGFYIFGGIPPP